MAEINIKINRIEEKYDILEKIGKGTYGEVFKCRDKTTQDIVAIKRMTILSKSKTFPTTSIREILLPKHINHDNIIGLKAIIYTSTDDVIYLAFDYCEYDLSGLIYSSPGTNLSQLQVISFTRQLILALIELKTDGIVHRDFKPANVLITKSNVLKVGDFGLARKISADPNGKYSTNVITLYYKPPELLMEYNKYLPKKYKYEVDMWSVGCIVYEMMTQKPLFSVPRGGNEIDILRLIFDICGVPSYEEWPKLHSALFDLCPELLSKAGKESNKLKTHLEKTMPECYHEAIPLLMSMLEIVPSKRISPEAAYENPYLMSFGQSAEPSNLPPIDLTEVHHMSVHEERKKREKIAEEERARIKTSATLMPT